MSFQFQTSHNVPTYQAWLEAQDLRPAYEAHRRFLQNLQWRWRGERWVLKAPAHLFGIRALLDVYPDAGVVLTHRDPLEVVGSLASLTTALRSTFSDDVDAEQVCREMTRRWADGLSALRGTATTGWSPPTASSTCGTWTSCAIRWHGALHLPALRTGVLASRRGSHAPVPRARHPKDKHGQHRYTLGVRAGCRREEAARYRPTASASASDATRRAGRLTQAPRAWRCSCLMRGGPWAVRPG
jgi:hypothetical protein